jgi:polyisoprenyl-teichoic acid--peptidoglycan teichoic acid transferase
VVAALPSPARALKARDAATAASRVRLRRALVLVAMTVFAPGTAQLVAGNKRVGRVAMRCAAAGVLFLVALVLLGLFWRSELVSLFTGPGFLLALRVGLILYGVGWAYLVVDAWRISEPLALSRGHRLTMTAVNGTLCLTLSGALLFASHLVAVQRDFITTVFGGDEVTAAQHGRYNILLLGGDAGPRRVGIRPDSITVASIDEETGRTVLFGLPRNLADVPFPKGSAMDKEFPHGFDCDGCYLNSINTWATDHPELFPHDKTPGITATTQAVEEITGLSINYYALIDLKGFQDLVDAVGGVTVKVNERIPIGGVGAPISGWIEPGRRHLDGFQTLWFSRSRATSDDYSRMARQKCVMNAMLHQLNPTRVLTNFGAIAKAGKQIISTSIPASELDMFVNLSLKTRNLPVATVSFVPPKINTGDPDFPLIRSMVTKAIAASQAKDDGDKPAAAAKHKKRHVRHDANDSSDLGTAC